MASSSGDLYSGDLAGRPPPGSRGDGLELRIPARHPFAGSTVLRFLRARAIPGVEDISEVSYRRLVRMGDVSGWVQVELDGARPGVVVRLDRALAGHQVEVAALVRRLFDLDARPEQIDPHLAADPALAPLIALRPGLRVPGTFDGWELAVRAILGQQVSVAAATTISGRLVQRFGQPWQFPTARRLAAATSDQVKAIGVPRARAATIVALAQAVVDGAVQLGPPSPSVPVDQAMAALQRVPGIGPWTASYIAIRAYRSPDLFLPGDLAARKALGVSSPREAERASVRWSPFRAYALMHLWSSL